MAPCSRVVDAPLLLGGIVAIVPAFAVLFLAYHGYEGAFKDNVLFLFFMAGLFSGVVLLLLEAFLLLPGVRSIAFALAMGALGVPALEQMLKAAALNRRKYQGDRAAVYYGGAFGVGFATMAALLRSQSDLPLALFAARGELLPGALSLAALSVALAALHFAAGVMVGVGVAERQLPRRLAASIVAFAPFQVLVVLYLRGCSVPGNPFSLVLADCQHALLALALAYALAVGVWAARALLPRGLDPNARRERRRLLKRKQAAP
jgi:hypothetical protein